MGYSVSDVMVHLYTFYYQHSCLHLPLLHSLCLSLLITLFHNSSQSNGVPNNDCGALRRRLRGRNCGNTHGNPQDEAHPRQEPARTKVPRPCARHAHHHCGGGHPRHVSRSRSHDAETGLQPGLSLCCLHCHCERPPQQTSQIGDCNSGRHLLGLYQQLIRAYCSSRSRCR